MTSKPNPAPFSINNSHIHNPPFTKNYGDTFLIFKAGKGAWLQDIDGKKYLDFGSGIAVNSFGHGRKDFAKIVATQMKTLAHTSNLFTSFPTLNLAARLVATTPLTASESGTPVEPYFAGVHLGNSGSEANETALKYARIYAKRKDNPNGHKILAFKNSFHGRTMGALSATWTEKYRFPSEPLVPGVEFIGFNDLEALNATLNSDFCAVIVEPIQGEGGLCPMTREFAASLNQLCAKYDVCLIADEIQTGLGRTGTFYASEQMGLQPDIICLAKPLAGGLPASATLVRQKIHHQIHAGDHGGTFGGNPVVAALACHILNLVQADSFLPGVQAIAQQLRTGLTALQKHFPFLGALRGAGMLIGIEINHPGTLESGSPELLASLIDCCKQQGLIVLRSGTNILRLAPPLTLTATDADKGLALLQKALTVFAKSCSSTAKP